MSRWHNIDGFADLPLGAFQAEQVGLTTRIKLHGGGGGDTQSTGTTTSYQSNLPEYAKPYYEEMMARAGEESRTPFQAYTGDQVAPFSAMQQQAQTEIGGMQTPGDISTSRGILGAVGAEAAAAKYNPNLFGSGYTAKPITSGYQAGTFTPGYQAGAVTPGYAAKPTTSQYQAGTVTPGYTAGTMTAPEFNAAQAAKYMSPYQQQVIDVEKREALRQGAQEQLGISAAAQQAGAFGGARHGVVEAEQKRNLAQQLGDIQTAGSQQAYDRAAGQFGADRAAQMEAMGQTQGFQQTQGQMGMSAQQATDAQRQAAAQMGMTTEQFNEAQRQQAGAMGMQAQQATDAQRQYQAQMGMTAQQAQEAAEQAESAAGMTAQQQTEAGRQQQATLGLQAQEKMEQSKQFSAQFRQQAREQQLKVSDAGAKLGQAEQSMNIARTQLQNAVGAEQKDQKQKELDVAEANFSNARDYERQQLKFYSAMLQGQQVMPQREVTQVGPGPNTMAQMGGLGISGLAAMNAFGGGK